MELKIVAATDKRCLSQSAYKVEGAKTSQPTGTPSAQSQGPDSHPPSGVIGVFGLAVA